MVAAFNCLLTWVASHPWLLDDQVHNIQLQDTHITLHACKKERGFQRCRRKFNWSSKRTLNVKPLLSTVVTMKHTFNNDLEILDIHIKCFFFRKLFKPYLMWLNWESLERSRKYGVNIVVYHFFFDVVSTSRNSLIILRCNEKGEKHETSRSLSPVYAEYF